jgi:peptidyl-prolyl cis-trans isomerase B (cyclophilin B)
MTAPFVIAMERTRMTHVRTLIALVLLPALAGAATTPPTRREKMARILTTEDRRTPGALSDLLHDVDPGVRRRAALAVGRIGDATAALALTDRLNDPVAEVRQAAAFALGLLGDTRAFGRLEAALKDHDAVVRARAAEALGRIGDPRAAPAVAQLVLSAVPKGIAPLVIRGDDAASPSDPWMELRLGLFALAALKDPRSAAAVLLEGGRPRFDWWAATWSAASFKAAELDPVLVAAAKSTDKVSRALAAAGLGRPVVSTGGEEPPALAALLALALDREDTVAARALRALGETRDEKARTVLLGALGSPSPHRRVAALQALARLGPVPRDRDAILALLGHEEPGVRAAALHALARLDPADLALALSGMGRDPVWEVRAALAEGLAGATDEMSLGLLFGLLQDDDARVSAAGLSALLASQGKDAALTLAQKLAHEDMGVRAAAAAGLASLKNGAHVPELSAAYRRSLGDPQPAARLAIAQALAASGNPAAKETLQEAARRDKERIVREAAARGLVALGDVAPAVVPDPPRPAIDYALAMAPYDPKPSSPVYTPRAFLHTRRGTIEIHLNTLEAPLSARSFIALARRGYFDGMELHRVVPGARIEGGDPRGDGHGGPGYTLPREAGLRSFARGAVGLESPTRDAEGSRFFITLAPEPERDGRTTLLGTVVAGMEVVEALRARDVIEEVEIWD